MPHAFYLNWRSRKEPRSRPTLATTPRTDGLITPVNETVPQKPAGSAEPRDEDARISYFIMLIHSISMATIDDHAESTR